MVRKVILTALMAAAVASCGHSASTVSQRQATLRGGADAGAPCTGTDECVEGEMCVTLLLASGDVRVCARPEIVCPEILACPAPTQCIVLTSLPGKFGCFTVTQG